MEQQDKEAIFNLGLATQELIHNQFNIAVNTYLAGHTLVRANALLGIKRMVLSEISSPEIKAKLETLEIEIESKKVVFTNCIRSKAGYYNPNEQRYMAFNLQFSQTVVELERLLNQLEELLREQLKGYLFPKTLDKRFALGR